MPFSRQQFFEVFREYNDAIWPAQAFLFLLAILAVIGALWRKHDVAVILASLWAWCGIEYHWMHFTPVNGAAWIFGALYIVAAALIVIYRDTFTLDDVPAARKWIGLGIVLYALAGYPAVSVASGHIYPEAPTFGAPSPLTIFTFGFLLLAARNLALPLVAVPVLWSVIGSAAIFHFGMIEDAAMPVAAAAVLIFFFRERSRRSAPPAPHPSASALPRGASPSAPAASQIA